MSSVCLRLFVPEAGRHHGKLTYEWVLDAARQVGVDGGTAYRTLAGFGRHGRHDESFFELAGELPVVVEFFLQSTQAEALLKRIAEAGLNLRFARFAAEFGITE